MNDVFVFTALNGLGLFLAGLFIGFAVFTDFFIESRIGRAVEACVLIALVVSMIFLYNPIVGGG